MFRCKLCRSIIDLVNTSGNKRLYHFTDDIYGHKSKLSSKYKVNDEVFAVRKNSANLFRLVNAYRKYGHKLAKINPVTLGNESLIPELNPQRYGLNDYEIYQLKGIIKTDKDEASLGEIISILQRIYCNTLSAEFSYLENEDEKEWFLTRFEELSQNDIDVGIEKEVAKELLKSQAFEKFMATKFVSLKRYGSEGAESMLAFFVEAFRTLSEAGVKEIILGMPHRGRLSLLTGMLKLPPMKLFHKLDGNSEFPLTANATGDVISHFTTSVEIDYGTSKVHVTSLYNPSHLEAVNPVSMGKTRCKHQIYKQGGYGDKHWGEEIVNIQVHGDGAVMGQGINQETVLMSLLPFYTVGGSIHLIVNNQVAFTTPPEGGRGTRYASDIAKIVSAPVIHVNGDSPNDVVKAARLAIEYQRRFRQDVFVDMNCYRYHGHNELDDPTFTNPAIYKIIKTKMSVPDSYAQNLVSENKMTKEDIIQIGSDYSKWLNEQLKDASSYQPIEDYLKGEWNGYTQAPNAITTWDTGVDTDLLHYIGKQSVTVPDAFNIHPNLLRSHVQGRQKKLSEGLSLDWSTCEALAFGSLLYQGFNVRISGQDVGRGTFSHRHAMLVDQVTDRAYIPLNNLINNQESNLEIANSLLSEEAVLGFEYGMSIASPKNLILWEAQFGDFFNGAQIIIDTFITSGESKWMQCSGLVMMLPHGYDGAGPEHSSCRIERFLQLTDSNESCPDGEDVNFHVANPTTPAQYFHLLRRQMVRNYRKPLVIVTPKTLIRLPEATSPLTQMQPGTSFLTVLDDNWLVNSENVIKIIFTSGKHYYALSKFREESLIKDTAIIRIEELCPFPLLQLQEILKKYNRARVLIWSQEEPQNMGTWSFIKPRFENLLGKRIKYCGRKPLPAPAVGIGKLHKEEAEFVIKQPFNLK